VSGLADASLARWLPELDLNIIDPLHIQQDLASFRHDPITLIQGVAGKIQAEDRARRCNADLVDPGELQDCFSTAGIPDLLESMSRLFDQGHRFHQV